MTTKKSKKLMLLFLLSFYLVVGAVSWSFLKINGLLIFANAMLLSLVLAELNLNGGNNAQQKMS